MGRVLPIAAVLFAAGAAGRIAHARAAGKGAIDFYQFWSISHAPAELRAPDLYSEASRRGVATFVRGAQQPGSQLAQVAALRPIPDITNSPFLYAMAGWLLPSDFARAYDLHSLASLLALCLALFYAARWAGFSRDEALLAVALPLLASEAVASNARAGNVMELQLGMLAAFLALERSGSGPAAAAVLGAAVCFKPTLAPLLPLFAIARIAQRRERDLLREAGAFAGSALVCVALGALRFAPRSWADWLRYLPQLAALEFDVRSGNYAPSRLLYEQLGWRVPAEAIFVAVLGVAILAIWRARKVEPVLLAGLGLCAMLLGSRLVWLHYFVLLLPVQLWLCGPGARIGTRAAAGASLLLAAIWPLARLFDVYQPAFAGAQMVLATVLVFAACVAETGRQREPQLSS